MIRCPKCSFEQPPDRYCARCGVNMETFTVPTPPLSRRLAGSGGFNIFLVATVIVATAYFIYNRRRADLADFDAPEVSKQVSAPRPTPPAPSVKPPGTATANDKLTATAEKKEVPITVTAASNGAVAPESGATRNLRDLPKNPGDSSNSAAPETANKAPFKRATMTVYFMEIPQNLIGTLFSGPGESAATVGSSGTISDLTSRLAVLKRSQAADSHLRTLTRLEKTFEQPGSTVSFDQTFSEGKGLFIKVQLASASEREVGIEVQIENRGHAGGGAGGATGAPTQIQDFDGNFILTNRAAAYFTDIIARPQVVKPEDEEVFARHPVFKILTSPAFQQNAANLFVFFEVTGLAENP